MKIQVNYKPQREDIFVWGVWGQHTIEKILGKLAEDIENVNKALRGLYE